MTRYLVWFLIVILLVIRYCSTRPVYHDGDNVRVTSDVLSDPIKYPNSQLIRLAGLKVYTPIFPDISYGDRVVVEGIVNDGQIKKARVITVDQNKVLLSKFRESVIAFYQSVLPEPEAGLLAGIALGSKGSLVGDFYEKTKLAGVAHVVVASGTNITLMVVFVMGVLNLFFTRKKSIYFVILIIVLYLFVSGFDPPLIRAAIMSSALLMAQESGRIVSTWRVFIITAIVMLFYNPGWVLDLGFILSFVSTASLMLFEKKIRERLERIPVIFKESLSTTLAAQIGVSPIIFITFGRLNILSPLINVLVLWTVPCLMILGTFGGVIGLIWPFLGKLILFLSYPMLLWFTNVVRVFS